MFSANHADGMSVRITDDADCINLFAVSTGRARNDLSAEDIKIDNRADPEFVSLDANDGRHFLWC